MNHPHLLELSGWLYLCVNRIGLSENLLIQFSKTILMDLWTLTGRSSWVNCFHGQIFIRKLFVPVVHDVGGAVAGGSPGSGGLRWACIAPRAGGSQGLAWRPWFLPSTGPLWPCDQRRTCPLLQGMGLSSLFPKQPHSVHPPS